MRFLLIISVLGIAAIARADALELRGGRWFNGRGFTTQTMYAVDGVLHRERPARVDRTIRLDGKFVIPPLAEAHNHWLEPARIAEYNRRYIADGVLYVMDQANVPLLAEGLRAVLNRPETVDYSVALLGWTGPGAHPIQIINQFVDFGVLPAEWKTTPDRNAVLIVTTEAEVDERWPLLLSARPDFVKIFLLYSEDYERRRDDPTVGFERGIDPKLVPGIVQRAHRDGLRVSAHVYTAADFRRAVTAGADLIAHMPGTGSAGQNDLRRFRINDSDARAAARAGVKVITTLGWLDDLRQEDPAQADRIEREVIIPNVRLLVRHGVPLLIGSDQFRETPLPEIFVLAGLGILSNRAILRAATMDTPRAIFPGRKIGSLEEGDEATFLVLDADPLADLHNLRTILMRVKRGAILPVGSPIVTP